MACLLTRTGEPGRVGATRSDLSPACPVASQHLCTPHERSLGFSNQPREACLHYAGPQAWDAQSGLTGSLPRASVHPHNLPLLSPLPGAGVPNQCFSSCPRWLRILLQPWLYSSSASFHIVPLRTAPHVDAFDVCGRG